MEVSECQIRFAPDSWQSKVGKGAVGQSRWRHIFHNWHVVIGHTQFRVSEIY